MSQFIGNTNNNSLLREDDGRLRKDDIGQILRGSGVWPGTGPRRVRSFHSPWWPRSCILGESDIDTGGDQHVKGWMLLQSTKGAQARLGYQGVTRDVYNSPLGGCTVKLFRTSDDTKVTPDIVSAPDGAYVISTATYETHWIKIEKTGSPPVQGVSVSNIFPNV